MPYSPFARFLAFVIVAIFALTLLWPDDRAQLWGVYALGALPLIVGTGPRVRTSLMSKCVTPQPHAPDSHVLLEQSSGAEHASPALHGAQSGPPQSISVSLPLSAPSAHSSGAHRRWRLQT